MKRAAIALAGTLGILGVVLAASASAGPNKAAVTDQNKPILVGAVMAVTGPQSTYDVPPQVSAEIAAADINRAGGVLGRKLKVVRYDMKSDRTLGGTTALDAISKGAEVLLVTCDFDVGSPAALAGQKKSVVSMSLCAGAPQFGPQGIGPLAFTAGMAAETESAGGAEWAYKKKGWRTAYLLTDTTVQYLKSWGQGFEDRWKQMAGKNGIVGKDTFLNADPSIAAQITRIKALPKQPDVIAMPSFPPGGASAVRQMRAAGITAPILACVALDGTYWLKAVPGLKNFYVTNYGSYTGNDGDPKVNALYRKYVKRTGKPPTISYYIRGYTAMQALARGIQQARTTKGPALAKAMEKFKNVPFLTGPTTFTKQFHISFKNSVSITQIVNGKPKSVARLVPTKVPKPRF
jgi:branched-chain amino acid transport system substrate-binding protein